MGRLKKEDDDETCEVCEAVVKPYHYYEQQLIRRVHHFYLSREIGEPDGYVEMIHRIKMASAEEMIYIHLNTPGGHLDTGVQIVNAMQSSQAHIVCSVEAESHSLGTLIFLAADEFIVHDNCIMMFHNFSGGVFGKGHEQISQVQATQEWYTSLCRKLYVPFMTEDELERIIKGEDLWFTSEEIRERLKIMVAHLEKEQAKKDAAAAPTKKTTKRKRVDVTP